jgi:hypothetical protein
MSLQNRQEFKNTEHKLSLLRQWITEAKSRPDTPENAESIRSLVQMANQLQEEIVRYRSRKTRRAS